MLTHPFTGVLLCVLVTAESCRAAALGDRAFRRTPIALVAGFARAGLARVLARHGFAETGVRECSSSACAVVPFIASYMASISRLSGAERDRYALVWLALEPALVLAVVGAAGTSRSPCGSSRSFTSPAESARSCDLPGRRALALPPLLVAGTVGLCGLARLACRGHIVPAVWFVGCFTLGALGALGLAPCLVLLPVALPDPLGRGRGGVLAHATPVANDRAVALDSADCPESGAFFTPVAAPPRGQLIGTLLKSWSSH